MCCISGILALLGKIIIETEYYIVKLLYINLGTLVLENRLKQLTHSEALREMMHVLSHTDICS